MELITDANAASAFINGIVPTDIAAAATRKRETEEEPVTEEIKAEEPVDDGNAHLL